MMNKKIKGMLEQPVSERETVLDKLFQLFFLFLSFLAMLLSLFGRERKQKPPGSEHR